MAFLNFWGAMRRNLQQIVAQIRHFSFPVSGQADTFDSQGSSFPEGTNDIRRSSRSGVGYKDVAGSSKRLNLTRE